MDLFTSAIVYSLIVMFAYGVSNAIIKDVVGHFGPVKALVYRNVITVLSLAAVLLYLQPTVDFSQGSIVVALSLAIVGYFPFLFLVYGLERGKVGVIVPITSARIIISTIFGFVVLGELLTGGKVVAVLLAFVGVMLASLNFADLRQSDLFSWKSGVPFAVMTAILWGFIFPLFKYPSDDFGALFYSFVIEFVILLCGIIHLMLQRKAVLPATPEERAAIKKSSVVILVAGVGTAIAGVFNNLAFQTGVVSIASAIGGSSIVVSLIVAAIIFRERLTLMQYAGVFLVALSVVVAAVV